MPHSIAHNRPVVLSASTEAQTYLLFAVAMGLTVLGVFVGLRFAPTLLNSGAYMILLFAELGIVFTSGWWSKQSPLNYLMFGLFPLFSGITITPFLLMVLAGYVKDRKSV